MGEYFDYMDLFCFFRRFVCCKRISEFCLRSIQHFMIDGELRFRQLFVTHDLVLIEWAKKLSPGYT